MSRDEIIQANPLPDYLRCRGFSLVPAGPNFVTNVCPVEEHRKFHRCNTIDTAQNLRHCNDHDRGGTVIDLEALEKKITPAEAMRKLGGGRNGSSAPEWKIVATYDYTDENGALLFQCVRLDPKDFKQRRPDGNGGWIWNLQGVPRVLYGLREVLKAETVCVAEGEKDADNLCELGFTATTNPMGAGKWRDEFNATLRGKGVLVFGDVGDPDKAGERHTEAVIQSLSGKAKSVRHIKLPGGFHDVSDYIASFPSAEQAKKAITNLMSAPVPPIAEQPRVARVEPPETPTTIVELREVIAKNFPALTRPAEISLSIVAQLLFNDVKNPFALAVVDVPSAGKTILLNFFKNPEELAYTTDYFTAAAFVSHATNVRREELGKIDLLPRLRFKTAIVRELNSILGAKEDDLIKSLGILTRVLDGEGLEIDSGVHGRRGYTGDYTFMLLAGTTPIQPRVFKVMGNFGSRLFFLSLHSPDHDTRELIALNRGKDRKLKENECRQATENFLRTIWSANPNGIV